MTANELSQRMTAIAEQHGFNIAHLTTELGGPLGCVLGLHYNLQPDKFLNLPLLAFGIAKNEKRRRWELAIMCLAHRKVTCLFATDSPDDALAAFARNIEQLSAPEEQPVYASRGDA